MYRSMSLSLSEVKPFIVELFPTLERPKKTTSLMVSSTESPRACADFIKSAFIILGVIIVYPQSQI